jgi:hypothetical protein
MIRKERMMSTVTQKLLAPVVIGLTAGLLAQQASATEEMVVYGSAAAAGFRVGQSVFRADIESYIRSVNAELRITLDQDLKRTLAPKLELASTATRARG